ncbi:hypothetical protein BN1708_000590 [Verticillium longisporum]|uniref:Uncharacterized protein n=1 Tax=Verticillium longisporum TaxID=100787 RepID=A0A0G4LZ13_VERLO|nr:hypothetical protein BN1708_000590 [Verticillium longisporum]
MKQHRVQVLRRRRVSYRIYVAKETRDAAHLPAFHQKTPLDRLVPPPLLENPQPLRPLGRQAPASLRLHHALDPQQLLLKVVYRPLETPAPALGAAKGEAAAHADGADGIDPVGVLHDGELRDAREQGDNGVRVLDLGGVADAETDGLDLGGQGFGGAALEEDVVDEARLVLAWLEVLLVADVVEEGGEGDFAEGEGRVAGCGGGGVVVDLVGESEDAEDVRPVVRGVVVGHVVFYVGRCGGDESVVCEEVEGVHLEICGMKGFVKDWRV